MEHHKSKLPKGQLLKRSRSRIHVVEKKRVVLCFCLCHLLYYALYFEYIYIYISKISFGFATP